jgi:anion-transporting  ArsA/GET3 family ATPase
VSDAPSGSVLAPRLVIVTGKGGTGKTTVAATLARAAARAGRRVLAADLSPDEPLIRLLEPGGAPAGYAGRQLEPGLHVMQIEPFASLSEYLGLQIGVPGLVDRVVANRGFRELMGASPGWRELITLGKVWHLEQMRDEQGRPRFDFIVVDAPATGHGVAFLNVPKVVVSAVRAGPLRRHTLAVEEMLQDRERTVLLPVALAEELPTRETVELVERVREEVGVTLDRVIVNGVLPAPFPPGLEDLDRRLAAIPPETRFGALPSAGALARCAGFLRARHSLNRDYVQRIGELTGLPVTTLPYLAGGIEGPDDLDVLAPALLAEPRAQTAPADVAMDAGP